MTKQDIQSAFNEHVEMRLGRDYLLAHPERSIIIDKLTTEIRTKELIYFHKQSQLTKMIEEAADEFISRCI